MNGGAGKRLAIVRAPAGGGGPAAKEAANPPLPEAEEEEVGEEANDAAEFEAGAEEDGEEDGEGQEDEDGMAEGEGEEEEDAVGGEEDEDLEGADDGDGEPQEGGDDDARLEHEEQEEEKPWLQQQQQLQKRQPEPSSKAQATAPLLAMSVQPVGELSAEERQAARQARFGAAAAAAQPSRPGAGGMSGRGGGGRGSSSGMGDDEDNSMDASAALAKHGQAIKGLCRDMCPREEREARFRDRTLHFFETIPYSGASDTDTMLLHRAVKKFNRSAASKELNPLHVRPHGVLVRTVGYLFNEIVDSKAKAFHEVFLFVGDRFRAIRSDFVCQRFRSMEYVACMECIARFHLAAAYECCDEPIDRFEPKQNKEQASATLTTLSELYRDGVPSGSQAEMHAYMLLLVIRNPEKFASYYRGKVPAALRASAPIRTARRLFCAASTGNWGGFLRLVRDETTYLQACCLLDVIDSAKLDLLRSFALESVFRQGLTAKDMTELLLLDSEEEAAELCARLGKNGGSRALIEDPSVMSCAVPPTYPLFLSQPSLPPSVHSLPPLPTDPTQASTVSAPPTLRASARRSCQRTLPGSTCSTRPRSPSCRVSASRHPRSASATSTTSGHSTWSARSRPPRSAAATRSTSPESTR